MHIDVNAEIFIEFYKFLHFYKFRNAILIEVKNLDSEIRILVSVRSWLKSVEKNIHLVLWSRISITSHEIFIFCDDLLSNMRNLIKTTTCYKNSANKKCFQDRMIICWWGGNNHYFRNVFLRIRSYFESIRCGFFRDVLHPTHNNLSCVPNKC